MPDCSHPVIAMGTVVPMSKVEGCGSLIWPVDELLLSLPGSLYLPQSGPRALLL